MPFLACRSDGSGDAAGSKVWDRSTGRGTFGGQFGARRCNQWGLYGVYVCDSAATQPSSQITLGRIVMWAEMHKFLSEVDLSRLVSRLRVLKSVSQSVD